MTASAHPLSGTRVDLEHGAYRASLASVGASLRVLQHEARDLVVPFDADEVRPAYRGVTLAPWPNRVVDGRYSFAGAERQLSITEPDRGHALHGLACWLDYEVVSREVDEVVFAAVVPAQAGYPHRIALEVTYRLDDEGLQQTVTATNTGREPAPYGTGPHPYLVAGPAPLEEWTLSLPADDVLAVTPDRLIPLQVTSVEVDEGGAFDFREPRPLGDTAIDHAFTGLDRRRDAEGTATVTVTDPGGTGVQVTFGRECGWVQIHTADSDPVRPRLGLAVEPMTCAPDAFNSGLDLIVIPVGGSTTASWRIAAV
ncbi:aldose 1-epimerase family protein [Herbiconiux sp. CPCC 203407]|uniref:Aldose 1-epimerase family protein n=1 Tax=Herbiconiux oxytropis TaxID=2970915 RepID=A0AA41XJ41_9MICO|nr:aldose 1-epimerase family protein [Herbiconiux oxytropis]MCS5722745.1 aldose 1-epimerase family protein [Herbiconiux oxytropis]MCS5727015.1 aldose 1-epimerase family protein [Herbiconiux oxytropis]